MLLHRTRDSPVLGRRVRWMVERGAHILRREGLGSLVRKIKGLAARFGREENCGWPVSSMSLAQQYEILLERQRKGPSSSTTNCDGYSRIPLISIIVSAIGLPLSLLEQTISSVAQQYYAKWELIVVCEPLQAQAIRNLVESFGVKQTQPLHVLEIEMQGFEACLCGVADSSGEFVWFVKCGDLLAQHALSSVVQLLNEKLKTDFLYCDEDESLPDGTAPIPFFKPSWSPELLLSTNYLSYSAVILRTLVSDFIQAKEREQELSLYDCLLWTSERTTNIAHISRVLYHSRGGWSSQGAPEARPAACASTEKSALERALSRRGIEGKVEETVASHFRIRYQLDRQPLISIIIPTRDRIALLSRCIASIEERTTYARYEILILDNGSVSGDAKNYFSVIGGKWPVLSCPGPFNFSAINNYGASEAKGEYLLFLNDDTEVVTPEWLTIMMEQASRPGIGAVGAKLLYPNGRIQHGGVVLGVGGVAGHAFRHTPDQEWGYHGLAHVTRNSSAVTAACLLVSRTLFRQIQGFDPTLPVEYNDVDLCLRIRRAGQRIVYAPEATLYHYESATRKGTRCRSDEEHVRKTWDEFIRAGDPYYNVNLTTDREDWSLRL